MTFSTWHTFKSAITLQVPNIIQCVSFAALLQNIIRCKSLGKYIIYEWKVKFLSFWNTESGIFTCSLLCSTANPLSYSSPESNLLCRDGKKGDLTSAAFTYDLYFLNIQNKVLSCSNAPKKKFLFSWQEAFAFSIYSSLIQSASHLNWIVKLSTVGKEIFS